MATATAIRSLVRGIVGPELPSFANPTRYRSELDAAGFLQSPFCDKCPWDQDKAQIDTDHVVNYFNAVGHGVFNPASLALLGSW